MLREQSVHKFKTKIEGYVEELDGSLKLSSRNLVVSVKALAYESKYLSKFFTK